MPLPRRLNRGDLQDELGSRATPNDGLALSFPRTSSAARPSTSIALLASLSVTASRTTARGPSALVPGVVDTPRRQGGRLVELPVTSRNRASSRHRRTSPGGVANGLTQKGRESSIRNLIRSSWSPSSRRDVARRRFEMIRARTRDERGVSVTRRASAADVEADAHWTARRNRGSQGESARTFAA